ncbi:MAG: chloride channel protein [Methanomicrobiaceae archaeon]|nr:chloride channel protein [Methanomicrobiaceae archaeon]
MTGAAEVSAGQPAEPRDGSDPKLWQIVFIALVAVVFTAGYIILYALLLNTLWFDHDFAESNRWMIPAGVMLFSLLAGLCRRYLHAPTVIHGGFVESMKGEGEKVNYRTFPGALLSSLFSLLSGVSVGPEGGIVILVSDIAAFFQERLRIARESADAALGFNVAALASAFNGIIGSVLFTGVFATEFQVGGRWGALKFLTWNLLAGAIGYMFYLLLGLPSFARSIPFAPVPDLQPAYILYAIVFGVIGAMLAVFTGLSMQGTGRLMEHLFRDRVILPLLVVGAITAIVGYFIPDLLFSGEKQIHAIIDDPAAIGAAMLIAMAIVKILLLSLAFKSGYIGGPLFPILFSATMIGLAVHLISGLPVSICVLCIEASALALALGAPLTAILLVAVVGTADSGMILLLTISSVTAMILAAEMKRRRAAAGVS